MPPTYLQRSLAAGAAWKTVPYEKRSERQQRPFQFIITGMPRVQLWRHATNKDLRSLLLPAGMFWYVKTVSQAVLAVMSQVGGRGIWEPGLTSTSIAKNICFYWLARFTRNIEVFTHKKSNRGKSLKGDEESLTYIYWHHSHKLNLNALWFPQVSFP